MSNKMLAKRLLATGMSVAMSATMFATNSITIFAEEGSSEAFAVLAPADDSGEPEEIAEPIAFPELPEVEFSSETSDPVTVFETEDEKYRTEIVTTTNSVDIYFSDKDSTDGEGNQTDDYKWVSKSDTEGQTVDFTDAETIVMKGDVTVYLEDKDGNEVTVKNEAGEDVRLELPAGTSECWNMRPTKVVENEDGTLSELNPFYDADRIYYGYFEEDGTFVEVGSEHKDDEGVQQYYKNRMCDEYVVADTMYYYYDGNEKVYISEDMYNALMGGGSDLYDVKKEYDYNGETYSEDELKAKIVTKEIKEVNEWDYTVAATPDKLAPKNEDWSRTAYVHNPIGFGYIEVKKTDDVPIHSYKALVTGEKKYVYNGWYEYPVNYYFHLGDTTYVVEGTRLFNSNKVEVGTEVSVNEYFAVNTAKHNVKKVEEAGTPAYKEDTVYIRIYDKTNPDAEPITLTKEQYEFIKSGKGKANVSIVGDKYAVVDKKGNTVYLDQEQYTFVTEREIIQNVTTWHFYTVQDKYEKAPIEVPVTIDGRDYVIEVEFWQNERIGATSVVIESIKDGNVNLLINFAYSSYENGFGLAPTTMTDTLSMPVPVTEFGNDGRVKLTVKYTPAYNRSNVPSKPEKEEKEGRPEQIDVRPVRPAERERLVAEPTQLVTKKVLAATALDGDAAVAELIDRLISDELEEEPIIFEPVTLHKDFFFHTVNLGTAETHFSKNNQPEELPPYEPDRQIDTGVTVTPMLFAAAAPGQVLGEQRPLEADGAAVLGASRARGTADETTAPIARVLVMAAVAATALFLTRKKEENN